MEGVAPAVGRGKTAEALGEWTAIGPAQLGHSIRGADVATGPGGGGLQAAQGDAGFRIQKAVLGKKPRPIPTEQPSETLGERRVQAGDSWKDTGQQDKTGWQGWRRREGRK